jgi:integrase
VLHKALEDAVHEGLIARNVASIAHSPRLEEFEPTMWSLAEVRTFLAAARDRLGPLYILTACTGLRSGEVRGLRWKDVDLEERVLRVRAALGRDNTVGTLKTKGSRRRVELPALAISALRAQRTRQAEERLALGEAWGHGHDFGLVFTSTVGTALDGIHLLKAFYRLCDTAGLPRIRIHDLRHLQASLLLAAGIISVPPRSTSFVDLLGPPME